MDQSTASLYHTHGQMCTSRSYEPDDFPKPRVFPFAPWKSLLPDSPTSYHVSHSAGAGACNIPEPRSPAACNDYISPSTTCSYSIQRDHKQDMHPACRALVAMGYSIVAVKTAADRIRKAGKSVDADTLIDVLSEVSDGNDDVSTESDDDDELLTLEAASPQPQPLSVTGLSEDTYIPKSTVLSSDLPSTSSSSSSPFIKENHQEKIVGELRAENERLKQSTTCKVCLDAAVDTLFLPCRHLVCCRACADNVVDCPVCRERILGTVKTYLA